jgi:hypothetical protein
MPLLRTGKQDPDTMLQVVRTALVLLPMEDMLWVDPTTSLLLSRTARQDLAKMLQVVRMVPVQSR